MNIVPSRIQEQAKRVDRTWSLVIGISTGLTALWSVYHVFWLFYTAVTFSSVGWSPVALVLPVVFWVAFGVIAGLVSATFLMRYARQP
jgi:membrane protein YdbS with pleckstrin-like domain